MQPAWILKIQPHSFSHRAKLVTYIPIIMVAYFIQIKIWKSVNPPETLSMQSLDFFIAFTLKLF